MTKLLNLYYNTMNRMDTIAEENNVVADFHILLITVGIVIIAVLAYRNWRDGNEENHGKMA